ncbi:uncharacterized protein [Antedon mediterranea]|uniref:uncharacterized protein n=1 Tax=Antedon mediterranea TaxID=105859 RepID=UPI003AF8D7EB
MNFTLSIKIPDIRSLQFGSSKVITTTYQCSVLEPNKIIILTASTNVLIQQWSFMNPVCVSGNNEYVTGETLVLGCHNDSDPNVITTWKYANDKVLPTTKFDGFYIIHTMIITKADHNAKFICESKRKGTNIVRHCSVGPITVNYKPEVNITQISPLEYICITEARPPVNETRWLLEPNISKDKYIISKDILKLTKDITFYSNVSIKCEADNILGKETQTLNLTFESSQDEINNSVSSLLIAMTLLICIVIIFVMIIVYYLRKKHKYKAEIINETKKCDPKEHIYDYATVKLSGFQGDYEEVENEIYIGGEKVNNKTIKDGYIEKENEIYEGLNTTDDNKHIYFQLENPEDNIECENIIYQGL